MNAESFEALFRKHFKGLSYFAMEYVKDHDIAREIVQEAFVSLWEKRNTIELGRSPKSYLGSTVKNRCLNYLRDNKKFDRTMLDFEGLDLQHDYEEQDHLVTGELRARIENATQALPDKCREVFLKNRVEHKKYHEIADELGISLKTVEAQMSKALRIMREKLSEFISIMILILEIINKQ
ncbi:MAG TPA: RNA polymerase sigma-70 factor [Bacteroidales bacterium]|nr:RNA polymerase sigma-70 factor [Bacteroidales bacterium]